MKILVMKAGRQRLHAAWFSDSDEMPLCRAKANDYRGAQNAKAALAELIDQTYRNRTTPEIPSQLDVIGIRLPFGGSTFTRPVMVDDAVMRQLDAIVPQAPLHLPPVMTLLETCRKVFPNVPVVLTFETSFFVNLPPREQRYAIDPDIAELRRYGFHGIYHEAACHYVLSRQGYRTGERVPRLLSVCLEARPEIAAVVGYRPLMVTSGCTPVEGIPGRGTCGEIDPSVVLILAQKMRWGPEQINEVLTRQSGLVGLVGRDTTLEEVLTSDVPEVQLAREVVRYRMLLSCGAGIAAMGGLDRIVFSGRYAALGKVLGPYFTANIRLNTHTDAQRQDWITFTKPLERIVADIVAATVLAHRPETQLA